MIDRLFVYIHIPGDLPVRYSVLTQLKNLFYSVFDLIYKNEFSESKYKKLMAFLVNRLEISHIDKSSIEK